MDIPIRPSNYMSSFIGKEILKEFGGVDWNNTTQKSINNVLSIATSLGLKRARNEDRCAVAHIRALNGNKYSIAIVCDGVGSTEFGDQAANLAIASVIEEILLNRKFLPLRVLVENVVRKADFNVRKSLNGSGMTTLSMIASSVNEQDVVAANVGDSRVYSWSGRAQKINQITIDDTFENELKNIKIEDESILDARGLRGTLSQAIGEKDRSNEDLVVRLYGKEHFENAGALLVTDGAWKVVEVGFNALAKNCTSSHDVVRRILTFSNWVGGVDNISAIAIDSVEEFASGNFSSSLNDADIASVTVWSADVKLTLKENLELVEPDKSVNQENNNLSKKVADPTSIKGKEKHRNQKSQTRSKKQTLSPQLELVSLPNQQVSSDEKINTSSNKVKLEISTDK